MTKLKRQLCFLFFCCIFLSGCSRATTQEPEASASQMPEAVSFSDDLDNNVTIANPQKTAVLSGSLADAWLLAGGSVYATTEDTWSISNISLDPDTISLGSLSSRNLEAMISNDIDFVILSANIPYHIKLKEQLKAADIPTAYFDVETFDDYARMMKIFTDITGRSDLYDENVLTLRTAIEEQISRSDGSHPSVLFLRAYSKGVKAKDSSSMTGTMLHDLGCINIADSDSVFSENLSLEAIIAASPDYIFVTTMGNSEAAAQKSLDKLLISNPAWSSLDAVQQGNYYVLPKELFQNKPNKRWPESYRFLADILYGGE